MDNRRIIQSYINNFRRHLALHLKPNVGIQTKVFPFDTGCVIIIELGFDTTNKDDFKSHSETAIEALRKTNLFEDLNTFDHHSFAGTNIILTKSCILLIKENNPKEWSESKVVEDIDKLLTPDPQKETVNG